MDGDKIKEDFLKEAQLFRNSFTCFLCRSEADIYYSDCGHYYCSECASKLDPTCPECRTNSTPPTIIQKNALMSKILDIVKKIDPVPYAKELGVPVKALLPLGSLKKIVPSDLMTLPTSFKEDKLEISSTTEHMPDSYISQSLYESAETNFPPIEQKPLSVDDAILYYGKKNRESNQKGIVNYDSTDSDASVNIRKHPPDNIKKESRGSDIVKHPPDDVKPLNHSIGIDSQGSDNVKHLRDVNPLDDSICKDTRLSNIAKHSPDDIKPFGDSFLIGSQDSDIVCSEPFVPPTTELNKTAYHTSDYLKLAGKESKSDLNANTKDDVNDSKLFGADELIFSEEFDFSSIRPVDVRASNMCSVGKQEASSSSNKVEENVKVDVVEAEDQKDPDTNSTDVVLPKKSPEKKLGDVDKQEASSSSSEVKENVMVDVVKAEDQKDLDTNYTDADLPKKSPEKKLSDVDSCQNKVQENANVGVVQAEDSKNPSLTETALPTNAEKNGVESAPILTDVSSEAKLSSIHPLFLPAPIKKYEPLAEREALTMSKDQKIKSEFDNLKENKNTDLNETVDFPFSEFSRKTLQRCYVPSKRKSLESDASPKNNDDTPDSTDKNDAIGTKPKLFAATSTSEHSSGSYGKSDSRISSFASPAASPHDSNYSIDSCSDGKKKRASIRRSGYNPLLTKPTPSKKKEGLNSSSDKDISLDVSTGSLPEKSKRTISKRKSSVAKLDSSEKISDTTVVSDKEDSDDFINSPKVRPKESKLVARGTKRNSKASGSSDKVLTEGNKKSTLSESLRATDVDEKVTNLSDSEDFLELPADRPKRFKLVEAKRSKPNSEGKSTNSISTDDSDKPSKKVRSAVNVKERARSSIDSDLIDSPSSRPKRSKTTEKEMNAGKQNLETPLTSDEASTISTLDPFEFTTQDSMTPKRRTKTPKAIGKKLDSGKKKGGSSDSTDTNDSVNELLSKATKIVKESAAIKKIPAAKDEKTSLPEKTSTPKARIRKNAKDSPREQIQKAKRSTSSTENQSTSEEKSSNDEIPNSQPERVAALKTPKTKKESPRTKVKRSASSDDTQPNSEENSSADSNLSEKRNTPKVRTTMAKKESTPKTPLAVRGILRSSGANSPASIRRVNQMGESVLHVACKKNDLTAMWELIKLGADVNARDYAGWTTLHDATHRKNPAMVHMLLKNGAMVNVPGDNYKTPLHIAVEQQYIPIVEMLLDYGADPCARTGFGETPRDMAESLNQPAIMQLLRAEKKMEKNLPIESSKVVVFKLNFLRTEIQQWKQFIDLSLYTEELKSVASASHVVLSKNAVVKQFNFDIVEIIHSGGYVIDYKWVAESLKAREVLDWRNYEIRPDWLPGLEAARNNVSLMLPSLFDGYHISVGNCNAEVCKYNDSDVRLHQLWEFLMRSKAKVATNRCPDPEDENLLRVVPYHAKGSMAKCNYIVLDIPGVFESRIKYNMEHFKCKPISWLMECLINFKVE